jgi:hypothetical protein
VAIEQGDDRDEAHGVTTSNPSDAWRNAYHSPPTIQPACHSTLIVADRVARSTGVTRSMANALKIGLPAFIREFRTAIARITVHSTGENPSTTRNGMLTPWTSTTEVIWPNRRASLGWYRIAATVPSDVSANTALSDARSRPNRPWMYRLRKGITCPAPMEIRSPGISSRANSPRSRTVIPSHVRERRGSRGNAAGSPRRRSRPRSSALGRSSDRSATVAKPAAVSRAMSTRMTR